MPLTLRDFARILKLHPASAARRRHLYMLLVASLTVTCPLSLRARGSEDPATDKSEHQRALQECKSQLRAQHPEMDAKARREASKTQVGPEPQGVVPAKAAAAGR